MPMTVALGPEREFLIFRTEELIEARAYAKETGGEIVNTPDR